ncbi:hypothetical protein PR048_022672 [Dryococelus australis]|uniref:Transposase n=1 Tax=Dryococelus australis TaxID=614101 RepID=A0ABQ9GRZ7_9NEOP|nr:hypothetical protein PR048_022672 [Dryococelus australis]
MSGNYHDEINFIIFSKWVEEKLIPNFPANCLSVHDNTSYHRVQFNNAPIPGMTKPVIQLWLECNWLQMYLTDAMLQQHGHEVERLLPYHCQLNATEFKWNVMKSRVTEKTYLKMALTLKNSR